MNSSPVCVSTMAGVSECSNNYIILLNAKFYNVLFRRRITNGETINQLVLPSKFHIMLLRAFNDEARHLGQERTLHFIQDRCFCPQMSKSIQKHISNCLRCKLRKGPTNQKAPLVTIFSSEPMGLLCVDFLGLEPSKGRIENVLVMTDHFTCYSLAVPTRNQSARTIARVLHDLFICHYGLPQCLHSDQGRNFTS